MRAHGQVGRNTAAIVIGVVGHRVLMEFENLEAGIEMALSTIEKSFPGHSFTVLSSLAEGADRLVARSVLRRPGARLIAVLPLSRSDYIEDFESAESREEFLGFLAEATEVIELPPAANRNAAYEAAGEYSLDHSDVLVTVWDGQGAQGQGGTGATVARARELGLPIAWVHAGNRKPGTMEPTSLGEEQGKVTFERL
jgi:hypothetical protein